MSDASTHNGQQSRRKWPWVILLCIIALFGIVRLALMTGPVHRWVKNTIERTGQNQLYPQLSIGDLSGDLWNSATLTNVKLVRDSTVASIDTLHIEYNLWSYFDDVFTINKIHASNPFFDIKQQDDAWNVQQWLRPADITADTSAGGFAFSISELTVNRGRIAVSAPQMIPDSSVTVDNLNLAGSLSFFGDRYEARLADLDFDVKNTRLDSTISVDAAANAETSSISLEKLVVATGNSLLNASGRANLADSTAQFQATADPLAWKDLEAYTENWPVQKNINLSLRANGSARQFEVGLDANAEGIENFSLSGQFRRDSLLALTSLEASAPRLNLEHFMSDTAMPRLQNMQFKADGRVPIKNYKQGRMNGTLSAEDIRKEPYRLDALQGTFTLNEGRADIRLEPVNRDERLIVTADLSRIWEETPRVSLSMRGTKINPAIWLQDTTYTGSLTFNGSISGSGWNPLQNFWDYRLSVQNSRLMEQRLDSAVFSGRFSQQAFTNRSEVRIAESVLNLKAQVSNLQQRPDFSYTLNLDDVNLAEFNGIDSYPSSIAGTIKGKGTGSSLQNLRMQASVLTDSSLIKGEFIRTLDLEMSLADSLVTIEQGELASTIADANFEGQIHLSDMYNTDNRLDLELQIKDVSSFASNAGVDILQATGSVEGQLKPAGRDSLLFNGDIDLNEVNYNNQFITPNITGRAQVDLQQQPAYQFDVDIESPRISDVALQNITLQTEGRYTPTETSGKFGFEFSGIDEGRISQKGRYTVRGDSITATLTEFDLTSSVRTLSLEQPFHVRFANGALQTDTLYLNTKNDSAFLKLAVPYADSLRQKAWLEGRNLNLTVIQNTFLDEPIFEGNLYGEIQINRSDTSMQADADVLVSKLMYQGAEIDTLQLNAGIQNNRLTGKIALQKDGKVIADGDLDIPFDLGGTDDMSGSPVSGRLILKTVELKQFETLLAQAGFENTEGTLQFTGSLDGQVGQPEFKANFSLKDAVLSGASVDSLTASMDYWHVQNTLDINASMTSMQQRAFVMDAEMPLEIDFAKPDVTFPGPKDSVFVDIRADDFDLRVLNDFMNQNIARNLEGRIDGKVMISGPRNDLKTDGRLTLQKGAVRLVNAGIRLDNMRSTVKLEPNRLVMQNLQMNSGSGSLTAQGELGLEKLVPGELDISVEGQNFKAVNTEDYNALINLDLNVNGRVTKPDVSGTVEMINGFVNLDNFGQESVEQVELDTTLTPEAESTLYDSLSLDMDIEFNRRFFVRNQRYLEMEIELNGQLDVLKDAGKDLQLFGTLSSSDGYARPLGKRFELEEGTLAFSGPPDNPQINVRTLYTPPQTEQEIKIWYVIEGTVEDPQFKYESQPPMDLAGIISYTLFGQPFYKLNPAEQSVASTTGSTSAADFAVEILLDRVEALATRRLGIDVVRIENTRVGGDSGTSITTGWYINPKVFFAIQNVITGSTPTTGFYLEYYLQENLKLIFSQGNENSQGIDLQWEYDY